MKTHDNFTLDIFSPPTVAFVGTTITMNKTIEIICDSESEDDVVHAGPDAAGPNEAGPSNAAGLCTWHVKM